MNYPALLLLLGLLGFLKPAVAGDWWGAVHPNPASSSDTVQLEYLLPLSSCEDELLGVDVSRSGNTVLVEYQAAPYPEPQVCFGVPPPFVVNFNLGVFSAGDYTVHVRGQLLGSPPLPEHSYPFVVVPAATEIPSLSVAALILMSLLIAGIARIRLTTH